MSEPIHIISLGAGVQSSTMALMGAKGEILPMPTAAIFADTQDEPDEVYIWLDKLEKLLPFPVVRVTKGQLSADAKQIHTSKEGRCYTKVNLPFHSLNASTGSKAIIRKIKQIANIKRAEKSVKAIQWIGISLDEAMRMKDSREKSIESRWPLIELKMSRHDCLRWMELNGFPKPPKSACVFCPFHSDAEWKRLKENDAVAFERAVAVRVVAVRDDPNASKGHFKSDLFLHRSCKPLDQVDFSTEEERGQINMFNNECEGMCGV